MKNKIIGLCAILLALLVIGLGVSFGVGAFSRADDDDMLRVTFMVRGEVYQVHYLRHGSAIGRVPFEDPLFWGWAVEGELETFFACSCCGYKVITEDLTIWALLPNETLFEHTVSQTSFPEQIVIDQPIIVAQYTAGVLQSAFMMQQTGTLTFSFSSNMLWFHVDGVQTGNAIWLNHGSTVIRGSSIG